MKAKLVRTFKVSEGSKGTTTYRLLTAGESSDYYVDYYILQKLDYGILGEERWETLVNHKVSEDPTEEKLLLKLLHGSGVTSEVP